MGGLQLLHPLTATGIGTALPPRGSAAGASLRVGLAKYRRPRERIHGPPTPLDTTSELTQLRKAGSWGDFRCRSSGVPIVNQMRAYW
jgi:hypothetical protein